MSERSTPIIVQVVTDPADEGANAGLFEAAGYREVRGRIDDSPLRVLREVQPHMVVVHAGASSHHGVDFCRSIADHPGCRHRGVLLLSRDAGSAQHVAALHAGADAVLAEPTDPNLLLATVDAVLRRMPGDGTDVTAAPCEREERLRLCIRDAPVGIAMLDRHMRYLAASRLWIDAHGLDEKTLIGRRHEDLFPDQADRWKGYQRSLAGAIEQGEEEAVCPLTGTLKWMRREVRPWHHAAGDIGGIILLVEDITGRKHGQDALRKSHAFMRQIIDTDPNFIFAKDRDGRFTLVNQAVADCYGTTVQNLTGKTDADFNQRPDEVAWFLQQDREVMDTMTDRCIPEELITSAAGDRRWLQTVKRPILDEHGRAVQVLGVSSDITQRKQAEESLSRQLYLTRTITDNSTQALFLLDEGGLCTLMNRAAESMFGFSLEEIRARPLHQMIHHHFPDGRPYPMSACAINRALAAARPLREHEDVFIRKNGEGFPVLVAASPIVEHGRPVSTVIEVRDMTEAVRAKHALARVTDQLQLILHSAGEGIYGLDLDGHGTFINAAGAAMFGYREAELLGRHLHSLLHHSHQDGTPYPAEQCPIYAVLRDGIECAGEEQIFWKKDGSPLAVAYTCSPMLEGERVIGAVVVVRDITQGKRVQNALRESEERLRLALAAGQMGAWDVDLFTGTTRWDAKECALFGEDAERLMPDAQLFYDRVHPDDRAAVQHRVQAAIDSGELQQEFRVVHPDGTVRWLASRGLVLKDEDRRPRRMVGINFDITERKEMEERVRSFTLELEWRVAERTQELQQSQERLRALATELNLAEQRERKRLATDLHDYLAQLLVLIRLNLGQLKRVASGRESTIVQATEEVVNEALAYTRTLVTQLSPPVLHEFGLPAALRWLSEQMIRQELSVTVTQLVPDALSLPEDQAVLLFQSVRELLMNVKKHAGTHEAMVTIERVDNELRLTVRDRGAGLDRARASAPPASALSSKFGLFSIRERMRAIGGHFDFESIPGQGTTASLVLPIGAGSADSPTVTCQPSCGGQRCGERTEEGGGDRADERSASAGSGTRARSEAALGSSPMRVLLVDDHVMVREGLRGLLNEHMDVEVVGEAWDGEEAVAFADRLRPDVVLMDVTMPRIDGMEATRRIKAAYRSIAVIGLSVNASPDVAEAMLTSGADAFLSKEAAGEQIYQTIRAMVGKTADGKESAGGAKRR